MEEQERVRYPSISKGLYENPFGKKGSGMSYETLLYETADGITLVTVNRPKALNCLNWKTLGELENALKRAQKDRHTKVVMITGTGEKAFIAGADINELALVNPTTGRKIAQKGQAIFSFVENLGKPIIAVINGYCLGGGLELALACTMRIASTNAQIGLPEIGLGIIPGNGGTQRLSKLIGKGRALEMILSAESIDAKEAYRIGLVNKIFPKGSLLGEAKRFAQRFARKSALALRLAIQVVNQGSDLPLEKGLKLEASLAGLSLKSEDAREGMRAFLEKRKPSFKNC